MVESFIPFTLSALLTFIYTEQYFIFICGNSTFFIIIILKEYPDLRLTIHFAIGLTTASVFL